MKKQAIAMLFLLCLLVGCVSNEPNSCEPVSLPEYFSSRTEMKNPSISESSASESTTPTSSPKPLFESEWIADLAKQATAPIAAQNLPASEEIRAAYRWLIEQTYFADPVGLESWRYHSNTPDLPIPYVENRALSPLAYGVGSCEDFAAAMVVLLKQLGYPAQYVSGLTISVQGDFVDHAWTMVELDGQWYHLDAQLEQNISRNNMLYYRYFLKDDTAMYADHRWGNALAAYYGSSISKKQHALIEKTMQMPACPANFMPSPSPEQITLPARPNVPALQAELAQIKNDYLAENPPLAPIELNVIPPIYAVMPNPPKFIQNPLF